MPESGIAGDRDTVQMSPLLRHLFIIAFINPIFLNELFYPAELSLINQDSGWYSDWSLDKLLPGRTGTDGAESPLNKGSLLGEVYIGI